MIANTAKSKRSQARLSLIKSYGLVTIPGAVIMLLLLKYSVLSIIIFGLSVLHMPVFNAYVWNVLNVIIACSILWSIYAILKIKNPIQPAAIIAALSIAVFTAVRGISINSLLLFFLLFFATCIGYFVATHITKKLIFWGIVVALLLANILVIPRIASYIDQAQYKDKINKLLQSAREDLDFEVYAPGYKPQGMKVSAPELFGIDNKYIRLHVEYTIGGIEVRESAKLDDQEQLLNFSDNCDLGTLWSSMADHMGVSDSDVERSRGNLSKCVLAAKTENGRNVYIQQRGQWTKFYTELEGTNVILEFDDINRTEYDESFLPEIVKIINSLEPVSKDKIEYGRH